MEGILVVVCEFLGKAIVVGSVMGIMVRFGNIFIRAVSGKEDFL